jgi:hypothetical protein
MNEKEDLINEIEQLKLRLEDEEKSIDDMSQN